MDTASYEHAPGGAGNVGVTVDLTNAAPENTEQAGTDSLSKMENLRGSAFNDTLTGNGSSMLEGGAGADHLVGQSGGADVGKLRTCIGDGHGRSCQPGVKFRRCAGRYIYLHQQCLWLAIQRSNYREQQRKRARRWRWRPGPIHWLGWSRHLRLPRRPTNDY